MYRESECNIITIGLGRFPREDARFFFCQYRFRSERLEGLRRIGAHYGEKTKEKNVDSSYASIYVYSIEFLDLVLMFIRAFCVFKYVYTHSF